MSFFSFHLVAECEPDNQTALYLLLSPQEHLSDYKNEEI